MCGRECLCQKCKNGPCGICKYNQEVLDQCRIDGVEECEHFEELKEDNNETKELQV